MAVANLTLGASVSATNTKAFGLSTATRQVLESAGFTWTSGVGASQADLLYDNEHTLGASASANLDLSGSLTDAYGDSLVFAKIKAVYIKADSGNTNNVNFTRPGAAGVPLFLAAGDGIALRPGAALLWVSPDLTGVPVTATTADLLTITNSAGSTSVICRIVILGTSA